MLELLQTTYRCSRCSSEKPADEFAPSQRGSGCWCRDCYRAWYAERSGGMVDRDCDWCGGLMEVTARRGSEEWVFCSIECKTEEKNFRTMLRRMVEKEAVCAGRVCPQCGDVLSVLMRSDAAFCSFRCEQASRNATRKASWKTGERQERVSRAYIIGRDKGCCHLCGRKVPVGLITLDHLVPLAVGGSHVAENLRVACLPCNAAKGARAANEQLLLVG